MKNTHLPLRGLRPMDAGGIYLLSQISIYVVQSLFVIILGFFVKEQGIEISTNRAVSFTLLFLTQAIFIVTPIVYSHFTGISYLGELNLQRGISPLQVLLLVIMALSTIVAFMPISSLFIELIKLLGYSYEMPLPNYYENFGYLVLSLIFLAVIPAIGEETLFRGFVARGYRKFGIVGAFLLSSLLFATAHGNLLQLVYQFFLGLVLVTVYFATRSIYASMTVHMVNNGTALIINYILYHTTGSADFDLPLEGAALVFSMLGVSILGMALLTLVMWIFLRVTGKRQDEYIAKNYTRYIGESDDATMSASPRKLVDSIGTKIYGRHDKKGTNFITKYLDYIQYLNFSFEENELENSYREPEAVSLESAENAKDRQYYKDMLDAKRAKDKRWDRNMLFMALAFNVFVLIVNIINAFKE